MGIFDLFKKSVQYKEPPIPEAEKKYYRPDSYYTNKAHPGTEFERDVILFEERKKTTFPSENGLYIAEILLLEYCSYGTYPHPKTGYPGFWWFEYGIRNVGAKLQSLEDRGFIVMSGEKYNLTDLGIKELNENGYVPYMHKTKLKTTENKMFGPEFNVWSVHREMNERNTKDWMSVISSQKEARHRFLNRNTEIHNQLINEEMELREKLNAQDEQLIKIKAAEQRFDETGDIGSLIEFWEEIWSGEGLLFNGSKWTFRLPDLYIKIQEYDKAIKVLKKIKNPAYQDKKKSYIERIKKLKNR